MQIYDILTKRRNVTSKLTRPPSVEGVHNPSKQGGFCYSKRQDVCGRTLTEPLAIKPPKGGFSILEK